MQKENYTIFYADDDEDDRDFFKEVVQEINPAQTIITQNTGDKLLDALKTTPQHPALIFLDLNMPQKSGYQVLKEIRESNQIGHLPVVIFSTSKDEKAIKKTKELGASLYITKPNSYNDLKKIMTAVLSLDWQQKGNAFYKDFVFTLN